MNFKNVAMHMAVFLLVLNASATAVNLSGVGADWGVNPGVGGDERIQNANESAQNVSFDSGPGDFSLFSLFAGGGRAVNDVFGFLFAGPTMFGNLGFPGWAVAVMFSPLYFAVFGLVIYAITGRLL